MVVMQCNASRILPRMAAAADDAGREGKRLVSRTALDPPRSFSSTSPIRISYQHGHLDHLQTTSLADSGVPRTSDSFLSINLARDSYSNKCFSIPITAKLRLHHLVSHGRWQCHLILPLLNAHLAPMAPGASTRDHRHDRHVREGLVPGSPDGQADRRNRLGNCRATNRREPRTACVSPHLPW